MFEKYPQNFVFQLFTLKYLIEEGVGINGGVGKSQKPNRQGVGID